MKEVVLVVFGTRGDLHPFLGLGQTLQKRGYKVTLVSNQYYAAAAKEAGIRFFSAGAAIHSQEAFAQSRSFRTMEQYNKVIGELVRKPMFRLEYDFVSTRFRQNPQLIVVVSRFDNGACLACEKYGIRMVRLCLSPMHVRITRPVPEQYKADVRRSYSVQFINEFREIYGLTKINDYQHFLDRADLEIGLFPQWFGDFDEIELPDNIKFAGFPLFDIENNDEDYSIASHIDKYGKPIVFLMDSCIVGNKDFFERSIDICQKFFYPGIFISHDVDSIPDNIPENILIVKYANLKSLLPRSELLIHTGGIGTCARSMEANIPQIVIPRFHDNDQSDNGLKVALFGAGGCNNFEDYRLEYMPKIIFNVIHKENLREMRNNIRNDIINTNGLSNACDLIENMNEMSCSEEL